MDFLFRQKETGADFYCDGLKMLGVEKCMLKYISFDKDRSKITRKSHYHTSFEIHIIEKGYQIYEINGNKIKVESGQFLIISPLVSHVALSEDSRTVKHAITFCISDTISISSTPPYTFGSTPLSVQKNLDLIREEKTENLPYGSLVITNRVVECLVLFLRIMGISKTMENDFSAPETNERFLLAAQYVNDNVRQNISVSELASYCCISEKQLQRIFEQETGEPIMKYIWKKRAQEIEKLLTDPTLSLREISEMMHFNNEYYFNAFFKKLAGITPGAFRKSVLK